MDKLESMRVFIEVARALSFAGAGEKLGLSAPAVTRSIAALEANLGAKLFNRTTRHVRLTEQGAQFLDDSKHILEVLEEAEAAVSGGYAKPKGVLTVTAPILFGQKHVAPIITEYLQQNPEVSVRAMFYDRITSMVEEGIDIAVRIGHLKDSNLYATPVGEVRRVICGSPQYFDRHGRPNCPNDLKNHNVIFASTFEVNAAWHFSNNGKKETVKLTPRLHCNQNGAALKAALQGFGVTRLMSYQVAEELKEGCLECVLAAYEEQPLPVNVVYLEGRRASAKIRAFIKLAEQRLKENPAIYA